MHRSKQEMNPNFQSHVSHVLLTRDSAHNLVYCGLVKRVDKDASHLKKRLARVNSPVPGSASRDFRQLESFLCQRLCEIA